MVILGNFRAFACGVLLAGCAVPSLAAAPQGAAVTVETGQSVASAGSESRTASRSRRVELPFPLEVRAPEREPPAKAPQGDAGPHPFRETLFKRASVADPAAIRGLRLSRLPDFS
jgi:hypothetical protein